MVPMISEEFLRSSDYFHHYFLEGLLKRSETSEELWMGTKGTICALSNQLIYRQWLKESIFSAKSVGARGLLGLEYWEGT